MIHRSGNMWDLRSNAKEAFSLMKQFCMKRSDLVDHFEVAYRGMIEPPNKTKSKPKPILNTSDLF
jgi:hypothetical protein